MHTLRLMVLIGILSINSSTLFASSTAAIEKATSENKHLFIFFYEDQNEKSIQLQNIFDKTMEKLGNTISSIKINSQDLSEKSIIKKFDLNRAPMPFVVVLAPNGAITGGFHFFTEEQLAASIVSKGVAQCLKALQDRKLVFICLQNETTIDNDKALNGIADFRKDSRFEKASELVMIDPSNVQEQLFLHQLSIKIPLLEATTILISPPYEIIGIYQNSITKEKIMSDLQTATSGCCGSGSKCCPK